MLYYIYYKIFRNNYHLFQKYYKEDSKMKKLLILLLALGLLSACSTTSLDKEQYTIGVLQLVDHPSLDATYDGFIDELNETLGEDAYTIVYHNALGDATNVTLMAQQLVDEDVDLIYAIATNAAQAIYAATQESEIPVVFNAVTDPVEAGIVESMDKPGTHATGVSDVAPIDIQLALIQEIMPDAKNIGILFNTGEDNSRVQIEIAEIEAAKLGLKIIKQGVSNTSEIDIAASQLMNQVDALYNITDNMIVNATAQVVSIANDAKLPVFAAEAGQMDQGILAADSIDYTNLGHLGGQIAKEILADGKKPSDIAVKTVSETVLYLNKDVAEKLEITLSDEILSRLK